jgi:hypothetical protein
MRRRLHLETGPHSPTSGDRLAFAGWALVSELVLLSSFAIVLAPFVVLLMIFGF